VKVRGFRIELGEIQSVLLSHPSVKEAVVLATGSSAPHVPTDQNLSLRNYKRLVAFVVPEDKQSPAASELKTFLMANLPDFMVPSVILIIDAVPITPGGKIDHGSLISSLALSQSDPNEALILPRTPIEKKLAEIWAMILGIEQIGIHSNFFELGGHSLLATQVISRIREVFQLGIPVRSLFTSPSIAGLAAIIEQKQLDETGSEKLVEMLTDLDQLSDEEVEALLASEEEIVDEGI
jgi:acyl carrier protein